MLCLVVLWLAVSLIVRLLTVALAPGSRRETLTSIGLRIETLITVGLLTDLNLNGGRLSVHRSYAQTLMVTVMAMSDLSKNAWLMVGGKRTRHCDPDVQVEVD